MNRRNFLSSVAALVGCGAVIPVMGAEVAPCSKPFDFSTLNLPEDAIGVRMAIPIEGFDEILSMLGTGTGWGLNVDLDVEEDGTRWVLFDRLRQHHDHYKTKEDAIEGCGNRRSEKRVPFFNLMREFTGNGPVINPEWNEAKWMVVTILRFKPEPQPSPEPFKFTGVHWVNPSA